MKLTKYLQSKLLMMFHLSSMWNQESLKWMTKLKRILILMTSKKRERREKLGSFIFRLRITGELWVRLTQIWFVINYKRWDQFNELESFLNSSKEKIFLVNYKTSINSFNYCVNRNPFLKLWSSKILFV